MAVTSRATSRCRAGEERGDAVDPRAGTDAEAVPARIAGPPEMTVMNALAMLDGSDGRQDAGDRSEEPSPRAP